MNLVDGIEAFVKIADLGSFAAAARELNISPSAVSKLVSKTEEELGTRLLNRNTRGLSLTPEGEMFLERSRVILDELTAAKEELSSVSGEPRGKLRVSMPYIPSKPDKPVRGGSIGEQLQSYGFTGNGMFPWKGYAGFRFVEAKKEGEFDLVIVTHCNVIIVELKDWNHQPVTARGDTWYKGDMNMGRSPVSVTRAKKSL